MKQFTLKDIRLHAIRVFSGITNQGQLDMAENYCTLLLKFVPEEHEAGVIDMLSWLTDRAMVDIRNIKHMEKYGEDKVPDYLIVGQYHYDGNGSNSTSPNN